MFELNSLYQREVFFAGKFEGNKSLLFQAIGNYGAYARDADFQKDISLVIISNKVLKDFEEGIIDPFIPELENKLNQNNSPYRRMKFISEDHLVWYIENRINQTKDELTEDLLKKYKDSCKQPKGLFD